jgi:hypothetical protein
VAKPQIARVGVEDERWMVFRQAALSRGISVSAYLGRLVEAELKRREGRAVATITPEMPAPDQAIAALAEVRASIDELDDLACRLARSAVAHGAEWSDVASSLRLSPPGARRAYGARPG